LLRNNRNVLLKRCAATFASGAPAGTEAEAVEAEEETEEEANEETGKIEEWEVGFAVVTTVVVVVIDVSVEVRAGLVCIFIRVLWCTLSTVFLDGLFEL
jgi:hypothetical protein